MNSDATCTTCVLCLRKDYGYSNWTTEGTELYCMRRLNPNMVGMEEPYCVRGDLTEADAKVLDFAKTCPEYRHGAPVRLDVDLDDIQNHRYGTPYTPEHLGAYTDDAQALSLLASFLNNPNG